MNKISTEELFKIAYNHLQNKNYSKSIELFNKILSHFPENLSVLRNLLHAYAFSGDFQNAENTIKKVLKLNEKEPFAYQFYASILKNQDKIYEMINLIEEGLSKNLMNPKWKYQKELLFPVVVKDNKEIDKFRRLRNIEKLYICAAVVQQLCRSCTSVMKQLCSNCTADVQLLKYLGDASFLGVFTRLESQKFSSSISLS